MAYLALARKWRPKAFSEVVGQKHVVQALSNALDTGRVHHAFLFTGTRGVGKTTLARIFAKSLNCEQGTSAEPCQVCGTCQSIDEGRFVDLIEIDAASNTKVDDTRELLDNVQYAPTSGKYKVYLMDEVHMLSGHSFNALLKTLEEPPEHVKFLFATTDPQKLPVTILSRCLQFNLRAMRPEQVERQLNKILTAENIGFDDEAIDAIAKAADGSMRDGLSLLDQAIALGAGEVRTATVHGMLGTIKAEFTEKLLNAIVDQNIDAALAVVADMADSAVDFEVAMDELLIQLYHLSLAQAVPAAVDSVAINANLIKGLAQKLNAETLQLYYQIGLISKRDIALAPNLRVGFEMALLRIFAFEPSPSNLASGIPKKVPGINLNDAEQAEKKTLESAEQPVESTQPADTAEISAQIDRPSIDPSSKSEKINEVSGVDAVFGASGSADETPPSSPQVEPTIPYDGADSVNLSTNPQKSKPVPIPVDANAAAAPQFDEQASSSKPAFNPLSTKATEIEEEPSTQAYIEPSARVNQEPSAKANKKSSAQLSPMAITLAGNNEWGELVEQTALVGMAKELAMNCAADRINEERIDLCLSPKLQHLFNESRFKDIESAVKAATHAGMRVSLDIDDSDRETPAECLSRLGFERDEQVRESMHADPAVKSIMSEFGATIKENSIKPIT